MASGTRLEMTRLPQLARWACPPWPAYWRSTNSPYQRPCLPTLKQCLPLLKLNWTRTSYTDWPEDQSQLDRRTHPGLEASCATIFQGCAKLKNKNIDLDGRTHWNNIRIIGLSEFIKGPWPSTFFSKVPMKIFGEQVLQTPPELNRAQCTLVPKPRQGDKTGANDHVFIDTKLKSWPVNGGMTWSTESVLGWRAEWESWFIHSFISRDPERSGGQKGREVRWTRLKHVAWMDESWRTASEGYAAWAGE